MNIYQHGEVLLYQVSRLPKGEIKRVNKCVVAHSETGHHHVVESKQQFETVINKEDLYLRLFEPAKLVHEKTHDKHKTLTVDNGIYKVIHKTEYDPFAGLIKRVVD